MSQLRDFMHASGIPTELPGRMTRDSFRKTVVATLMVLFALGLRTFIPHSLMQQIPFLIFFSAVVASGIYGGFWIGVYATIISALISYYLFLPPVYFWVKDDWHQYLKIGLYILDCLSMAALCGILSTSRRKIQDAQAGAEHANVAKSAFLANMSHEIRTPLGAMMGFAELARQPGVEREEINKYLGIIERNSAQVLQIIDDILDLAKVESGRVELEVIDFSLPEFIGDFASLMDFRARENGIEFEAVAATDLPAVISADPTRIRQILANSVGNAVKFTSRGKVQLRVGITNDLLEFAIVDTGRGITPEQARNLFQAFVQADVSTKRKYGGTGLGLVLTKSLCQLMGGDYLLTASQPQVGSTFTATLKVGSPHPLKMIPQKEVIFKAPPEQIVADVRGRLQKVRVLVVEDSPDNQVLLRLFLERQGAVMDLAEDGVSGVERALGTAYDVVLMDIQMPKMDGHEAMAKLKAAGYTVPVIALTAHAMKQEVIKARESGFADFLTKPIQQEALITMLIQHATK